MRFLRRFLLAAACLGIAACGSDNPPVCSLDGGVALGDTAWPKFRGDERNTGRSRVDLSAFDGELIEVWRFRTNGAVVSSPAIGPDSEIYIGSGDTNVYRIGPGGPSDSGNWQFGSLAAITTGPAIDQVGQVYVTSNDGNLYTLESFTGESLRSAVAAVGVLASPNVGSGSNAGVVYVGSLATGAFAICPNNVLRWASQIFPVANVPALGFDGTVYLPASVGARTLSALDPGNGQTNWIFTATAPILAAPIVGDDASVFVVDSAGRAFVLDPVVGTSGGVLFDVGAGVTSSPALGADGTPGADTLYVADQAGKLTAIDLTSVNPSRAGASARWTFTVPGGAAINSSPAVTVDGTILFGADDGVLYAVRDLGNAAEVRWTFTTAGPLRSSPAVADDGLGTIYFGSSDGSVYAVRPE